MLILLMNFISYKAKKHPARPYPKFMEHHFVPILPSPAGVGTELQRHWLLAGTCGIIFDLQSPCIPVHLLAVGTVMGRS